jgi:hypothetical protein
MEAVAITAVASVWGAAAYVAWKKYRGKDEPHDIVDLVGSRSSSEDIELWNQLWMHPEVSDAFYTWNDDKGFVERPLDEALQRFIGWGELSTVARAALQGKLGVPRDGYWGLRTERAILKHGLWQTRNLVDGVRSACTKQRKLQTVRRGTRMRDALGGKRISEYLADAPVDDRGMRKLDLNTGMVMEADGINPHRAFSRDYGEVMVPWDRLDQIQYALDNDENLQIYTWGEEAPVDSTFKMLQRELVNMYNSTEDPKVRSRIERLMLKAQGH